MWTILMLIVVGMVAGWVASLIVRGEKHPRDWALLFAVGLAGSFLGGILANLIAGNGFKLRPAGLIGSIILASILLWLITRAQNATRRRRRSGEQHRQRAGGQKHHKR
jgi:uncharacterized membrane protein YeaQ/YmgE (transglycosylase-associated protein family)